MEFPAAYSFEILLTIAIVFGSLSIVYAIAVFKALRRLRLIKVGMRLTLLLIFIPMTLLSSGVILGLQGYQSLTHESLIAQVVVEPYGPQEFQAVLEYPDGTIDSFLLKGDEVQIDANIIKWRPFANIFGLHTHYELTRISGRYADVDDARKNRASAHSLTREKLIDLVKLRLKNESMQFLMDAEYGSATFLPASRPATYELRLSTSGLLLRKKDA